MRVRYVAKGQNIIFMFFVTPFL